MINNNFRLFANCFLTKGISRSTITDLQNGRIKTIPNDLYQILKNCRRMTIGEIISEHGEENKTVILDYFQFLIKEELIFFLERDEIDLFPDIETVFEFPGVVSNAILDLCSTSCYSIKDVIKQLDGLGCQHAQIRSFDQLEKSKLIEICNIFEGLGFRSIQLVLPFSNYLTDNFIENIVDKYPRITSIVIHSNHEFDKKRLKSAVVTKTKEQIVDEMHCGFVNPTNFVANIYAFTESLHFNSCLNKKISVDKNGIIRNCPAMKSGFGNIHDVSLKDVCQKEGFIESWHIKKDEIEICSDCEFRHVCTDCRAIVQNSDSRYSKPKHCTYDPYTTIWRN